MSNGTLIREVIIKTRVQHEKSREKSQSSSGKGPMADAVREKNTTKEKKKQEQSSKRRLATEKQLRELQSSEIMRLKKIERIQAKLASLVATKNMTEKEGLKHARKLSLEKQEIENRGKAAIAQAKRINDHEKERVRNAQRLQRIREKMSGVDKGLSGAGAANLTMSQRREIAMLADERARILQIVKRTAVVDIEGKIKAEAMLAKNAARRKEILALANETAKADSTKRVGGPNTMSSAFSTGNKTLDAFNAKGFQMFMTAMSAQMAVQIMASMAENAAGLADGMGESFGARLNQYWNNNRVMESAIENVFVQAGERLWHSFGVNEKELGEAIMGYGQMPIGGPRHRNPEILRGDRIQGLEAAKSGLGELLSMWEKTAGKAHAAAEQELAAAEKRLEMARQEFGLMSAMEQRDLVGVARRFEAGGDLTTSELNALRNIPGFEESTVGKKFADKSAAKGNFSELDRILGFSRDVSNASQEVAATEPIFNIGGVQVNLTTAIEDLDGLLAPLIQAEIQNKLLADPNFANYINGQQQRGSGPPSLPSAF